MLRITDIMSEFECYSKVRELRWPDGEISCPRCQSNQCKVFVKTTSTKPCQKYRCENCNRYFNDLTDTVFKSSNLPLKHWLCCLYLMGLNSSNRQIAKELGVSEKTAQNMTKTLREEVRKNRPNPELSGKVECDEVYIVAGHKGHPDAVKKRAYRPQEALKGRTRQRNIGKRKATRFRHGAA